MASVFSLAVAAGSVAFVRGHLALLKRRWATRQAGLRTTAKHVMRGPCGVAVPMVVLARVAAGPLVIPLLRTYLEAFDCTVQADGTWTWDRDTTSDYHAGANMTAVLAQGRVPYGGDYPCGSPLHVTLCILAFLAAVASLALAVRLIPAGSLHGVTAWRPRGTDMVRTDTPPFRGPFTATHRHPLNTLVNLAAKVRERVPVAEGVGGVAPWHA